MILNCNYPEMCPDAHIYEGGRYCQKDSCLKAREGIGPHFEKRSEVWENGCLRWWSSELSPEEMLTRTKQAPKREKYFVDWGSG